MSAGSRTRAETVVIGGGVIGLAIAYELCRRDCPVLVLERDRIGAGASGVAAGMLAPISEAEFEEPELTSFGLESLSRYPRFVESLERVGEQSCGYRREGTLWVEANRDHAAQFARLAETVIEKGLQTQRVDTADVLRREPHLSGRVLGGWLVASDHQVDPRRLVAALARGVTAHGGRIETGMRVERLETRAGVLAAVVGRSADGEDFEFETGQAVLAAGAWSEHELEFPGRHGVRPIKGELVRLQGGALLDHVIRTPDVYLIPRTGGELLVGATMDEVGYDTRPTAGAVMDLLGHAWRVLPDVAELEFVEVSVGLRSAVSDHLPVIGESETAGLYLAFGHHRNGILLAPATAHHLAEWMTRGVAPVELQAFRPRGRRETGEAVAPGFAGDEVR